MTRVLYVVNPAGHGGTGIKTWERVQSELSSTVDPKDVHFTARQGHARQIATAAEGYDVYAAVGGDGTVGEVLSGIMAHEKPRPKLAIVPAGTGNDIARNLGITSLDKAARAFHGDHVRDVDLIRIDCQVESGPAHRYAFLMGNVGFSALPMIRPWMKRFLGPKGAYYLGTILQIIAYQAPNMTVRWENQEFRGRAIIVIVANVERTAGGSMCVAPGAECDDGMLSTSIVPLRSKFDMMTHTLPKLASGDHIHEPGVSYFSAERIELKSQPDAIVEIDGDLFGKTPGTFTLCPKAVQILCPEAVKDQDL